MRPTEPTGEQCTARHRFIFDGRRAVACWYPQMGGYCSKAVLVDHGGCFQAYVWHDGEFPFGDGRAPRELHHCDPQQFIDLGELAAGLVAEGEN